LERGGSSVVGRGLADHDQQHCYHLYPYLLLLSCKCLRRQYVV